MALINSKGNYIKLELDGKYIIYASAEARKKIKESTPGETILLKYKELLADLLGQEEFKYYDPEGFYEVYQPLAEEYSKYEEDLKYSTTGNSYPIMSKIYPDVSESIPEIIGAGRICRSNKSVEDAYIKAKQIKRFGETTDA